MGKKRRPFINKKTAATFSVVQRSQHDPTFSDPNVSKMVLQPSNDNPMPEDMPQDVLQDADAVAHATRQKFLADMGLVHDYDYTQHLKPFSGTGVFYSADNDNEVDVRHRPAVGVDGEDGEGDEVEADKKQLGAYEGKSYAHATKDFFEALEDDEDEGDFEELQEDFVVQATAEGEQEEEDEDEDEEDEGDGPDWNYDEQREAADEGRDKRGRRLVDDHFDRLMENEYGDDLLGELEEEDPEVMGTGNLGDFQDALVAFQDGGKLKDFIPGHGQVEREGKKRVDESVDAKKQRIVHYSQVLAEEEETGPSAEALIDKMFTAKKRDQWDCESIISTYSTHSNHPSVISAPRRGAKQIILLERSGLAADYLPHKLKQQQEEMEDEGDEDEGEEEYEEEEYVNKGEKRNKQETKAEKKARKAAIKAARRRRREDKKNLKGAYNKEEKRQRNEAVKRGVHNAAIHAM